MLTLKTGLLTGKFLLGAILIAGLAGPAFAGNVYSWVSEDGTYSFTDDPKLIPAKHRSEAKKKSMGRLTRYERYTGISSDVDKPYAERIRERRTALRSMDSAAPMGAVAGALQPSSAGMNYSIPVGGGGWRGRGGASVDVPLGNQASAGSGQTTIRNIRVRLDNSIASRHITVIEKDGEPVTVIKGELNQRGLDDGPREEDFDR